MYQKEGHSLLIKRHVSESLFSQGARRDGEPEQQLFIYTTKKAKSIFVNFETYK